MYPQGKGCQVAKANDTRMGDDENKDEGLYNELKEWKPASGS